MPKDTTQFGQVGKPTPRTIANASPQIKKSEPDVASAGHRISTVTCLLNTLLWAAEKCQDSYDFEQFHSLVHELAPRMGVTLELAVQDLGEITTGLFELDGERCNG